MTVQGDGAGKVCDPPSPALLRYPSSSPSSSVASPSMRSSHSPHTRLISGLPHAFNPQPGQVYFVLLAAFFFRFSGSLHNST